MVAWLEAEGVGNESHLIVFSVRLALFSRQRDSEPIQSIHWEDGTTAVPESELPLVLPVTGRYPPFWYR